MIIYKTTNNINNKKYIGLDTHNNPLYLGSGILLLKAIQKYGKENFTKEILDSSNTLQELNVLERFYISKENAVDRDDYYNLSYGGEGISGRKHSAKTKQKISNTKLNSSLTEEQKYKIGSGKRGMPMPQKTREALLKANIGRENNKTQKETQSQAAIKRYDNDGVEYPILINKYTNEEIKSGKNIRRLAKKLKVSVSGIWAVIKGKQNSCYGWVIKGEI